MLELQDKKKIRNLGLLLAFAYMTSYITRINFGAVISEMESAVLQLHPRYMERYLKTLYCVPV